MPLPAPGEGREADQGWGVEAERTMTPTPAWSCPPLTSISYCQAAAFIMNGTETGGILLSVERRGAAELTGYRVNQKLN